jgi:hypothetical protein
VAFDNLVNEYNNLETAIRLRISEEEQIPPEEVAEDKIRVEIAVYEAEQTEELSDTQNIDGDQVPDKTDLCPEIAGDQPNGCPPEGTLLPPQTREDVAESWETRQDEQGNDVLVLTAEAAGEVTQKPQEEVAQAEEIKVEAEAEKGEPVSASDAMKMEGGLCTFLPEGASAQSLWHLALLITLVPIVIRRYF